MKEYFLCRFIGAAFVGQFSTMAYRLAKSRRLLEKNFLILPFYSRAKKQLPVLSTELYAVHHCIDGNYGIADLRGVRKLMEGGGFDG